jgi:WD40 repeat protein
MRSWTRRVGVVAGASVLALAAPFAATSASAHPSSASSSRQLEPVGAAHVVFVQTNQPAANTVVAYARAANGSLTQLAEYQTGGKGGVAVGAVADPLASQGSLVYDRAHALLLAVNAGSNTVTVFGVRGDQLDRRQVVGSGGQFPVSLAVHGDVVYVLNGGGDGSVSGFRVTHGHLAPIAGSTRALGLAGTNPPAFLASPAQVGFSPDGRHLVVSTKTHNTIDVFDVAWGGRLSKAFVANPAASPVPFAFTWSHGYLVMTEAGSSNVTIYRIRHNDTLQVRGGPLTDNQVALCWIAGAQGHFFGSNTGTKTISAYRVGAGGGVTLAGGATNGIVATTDAVPVDLAATMGQRYLYVQEPTAGEIQGYAVHSDGTLTLVTTVTGLPTASPMEGLVAA